MLGNVGSCAVGRARPPCGLTIVLLACTQVLNTVYVVDNLDPPQGETQDAYKRVATHWGATMLDHHLDDRTCAPLHTRVPVPLTEAIDLFAALCRMTREEDARALPSRGLESYGLWPVTADTNRGAR